MAADSPASPVAVALCARCGRGHGAKARLGVKGRHAAATAAPSSPHCPLQVGPDVVHQCTDLFLGAHTDVGGCPMTTNTSLDTLAISYPSPYTVYFLERSAQPPAAGASACGAACKCVDEWDPTFQSGEQRVLPNVTSPLYAEPCR